MEKHIFFLFMIFIPNNCLLSHDNNPSMATSNTTTLTELQDMVRNLTSTVSSLQASLTAEKAKVTALQTTVPLKQFAFTVCHTLSEHLGDHQAVIYNRILANIGQAYDVSNGQFTAPVGGLYTFSVTGMAYGDSAMYLELVKNSANLVSLYSNAEWADTGTNMAHVHLNVGDRVWVRNEHSQGQLHPYSYNCWSGILQSMG